MDKIKVSSEALEFSRKRGSRASECLDCGGEPMPTRRYCAPCRAAREKTARLLRREKNASKPCAVDGCQSPRHVTDSQTSAYCLEHKNEKAGAYRKKARTPEQLEERPCKAGGCTNIFTWRSTHPKQRYCSRKCREVGQVQERQRARDRRFQAQFLEGFRLCRSCDEIKAIDEFPPSAAKRGTNGISTCRSCARAYQERYKDKHRDRMLENGRQSQMRSRLRKLNAPSDDIDELISQQGGVCSLCSKPFGVGNEQPAADHDHTTGRFRAIIHQGCNAAIGHFNEDPDRIQAAIAYLNAHSI